MSTFHLLRSFVSSAEINFTEVFGIIGLGMTWSENLYLC